jgi:hypothetical protein
MCGRFVKEAAQSIRSSHAQPSYIESFEHHTDWVNDITICDRTNAGMFGAFGMAQQWPHAT